MDLRQVLSLLTGPGRTPDNPPLEGSSPEEFRAWTHTLSCLSMRWRKSPQMLTWEDLYLSLMGSTTVGVAATFVKADSEAAFFLNKLKGKLPPRALQGEAVVQAILKELDKQFGPDKPPDKPADRRPEQATGPAAQLV